MWAVTTPEKIIKLTVSDYVRKHNDSPEEHASGVRAVRKEAFAGLITGIVSALIVTPFEGLRIPMQLSEQPFKEIIWKTFYLQGLRRSYRGFSLCLYRDVTANILFFSSFGQWKEYFRDNKFRLSSFDLYISLVLAISIGAYISNPFDVMKSMYTQKT